MEQHGPRGPVHRQIAMYIGGAFARSIDRCTLKRNRRKLLHIKKFGREQMMVAILDTGVDALDLNSRLNARSLRLRTIKNHRPRKVTEFTGDAGRKMADLKA